MPKSNTTNRKEVLVALLKTPEALHRARDEHWYHVPVEAAKRRLKDRWPPRVIAFYQGHPHGSEAFAVRYYANVEGVIESTRRELFPSEPNHPNAGATYYRVSLGPLRKLDKPIVSRRLRRIVFIPTTWQKFVQAVEINDLYDESPLEDRLWAELKRHRIYAERQEYVQVNKREYALDFAVYGVTGKLDIETDGDTWHAKRAQISADNQRDNDLSTEGWTVLRFNTQHVREQMADYCMPSIGKAVRQIGGVTDSLPIVRSFREGERDEQLGLFDLFE